MKKRMIAAAVTTMEALEGGIQEEALLLSIENPLYGQIRDTIHAIPGIADYKLEAYPDKQVILLKRARGNRIFDEREYEVFYLPLQLEGWSS